MRSEAATQAAAGQAAAAGKKAVVIAGLPKLEFSGRLVRHLERVAAPGSILCLDTIEALRQAVKAQEPKAIIVDDRILGRLPLAETLAELATVAPVLLVAAYERHSEIGRLLASGQADFVPRAADWELLAASLIERRLRSANASRNANAMTAGGRDEDIGEIFRHEINNPLTGILGNAELLLAHGEKFPPAETQRIRTVVELAVRLRETVRRVSERWGKA